MEAEKLATHLRTLKSCRHDDVISHVRHFFVNSVYDNSSGNINNSTGLVAIDQDMEVVSEYVE